MEYENLVERRNELRDQKKSLCDEATKDVVDELAQLDSELKTAQLKAQRAYREEFKAMSIKVGDMFRMAFELYTVHGIDLKLALTNHVEWIEVHSEKNSYDTWFKYAHHDRGSAGELRPAPEGEFEEAYKIIKDTYDEVNNGI